MPPGGRMGGPQECVYRELYETQFSKALMEEDGVSELEQYIWGVQPGDEPHDEA